MIPTTTSRTALALALAAGCSSPAPQTPKDATGGEGGAADAAPPDGPPPLPACANPVNGTTVTTREIGRVATTGAMLVTAPVNDPRLFVVERRGSIRIFENETLLPEPFLDLSADADGPVLASTGNGENGLLGLAFHPDYAANGQFFIFYTRRQSGDATYPQRDVLARCARSATDPNKADPASCVDVLAIRDFAANHNGGMIEFGGDGYLYVGTGDGGGAGDPDGNGQTLVDGQPVARSVALLGKMLRLDVDNKDAGKEYGIPPTNPFASGGGPPEVFMLGLRNPWRWSFDRATGDMWIGDVGQGAFEELTVLTPAEQPGANLGWDMYEGNSCFTQPCSPAGKVFPQDVRGRSGTPSQNWISIIGGQVYRGTCYPGLVGTYFYTDYGAGGLHTAVRQADGSLAVATLPGTFPTQVASIHADARGELFITTNTGFVHRIEAGP